MNTQERHGQQTRRLLDQHCISEADLDRVRAVGQHVQARIGEMTQALYQWIETTPTHRRQLSDRAVLLSIQEAQDHYWTDFLQGRVDDGYVEGRVQLGQTHATAKLPLSIYLGSVNFVHNWLVDQTRDMASSELRAVDLLQSVSKLIHFDVALVVGELHKRQTTTIDQQARSLMELSTPVMRLWKEIVLLPLVGVIDTARAQQLIEALLHSIVETESQVAILDVTGVPIIDTRVAQHILKTVSAAKMLGAEVLVTGISPEMAQTMTKLDIRTDQIHTCGTLSAGLGAALTRLGQQVTKLDTPL